MTAFRLYRFEEIDDALDLVPLAARRALDAARIKLSLESWRASPLETRRAIATLGAAARVDAKAVHAAVAEAHLKWLPMHACEEPSADVVPPELGALVTWTTWGALEPADRYALWKVAHGSHPEEALPRACAEIAPLSTHIDQRGRAHMVDVGAKDVTARLATAFGYVTMEASTVARLRAGDVAKGDVLATARIAGIQAAKRTSELIPLCHMIALTRVTVDLMVEEAGVSIRATAEARDRTGVEMEALTAASVAALTLYDMLKSVDRGMRITIELAQKSGGKTGDWVREGDGARDGVRG